MGYALRIYEAFKDDETKARLLSEFIEMVEQVILNNQIATRQDITMSELKLTKEIEQVRAEMKEIELKLTREIEQVRSEMKETELKLTREIEQVRADVVKEIAQVRVEMQKSHGSLLRWIVGLFLTAVLAQAGLIIALLQYASHR